MDQQRKREEERRGLVIGGLITLGIGTLFLLSNLDVIPGIHVVWPVIIIIVGVALVVGSFFKGERKQPPQ